MPKQIKEIVLTDKNLASVAEELGESEDTLRELMMRTAAYGKACVVTLNWYWSPVDPDKCLVRPTD